MLANNEIGVIQPLAEIAKLCHHRGAFLHCDATQAVGRIPVNVGELGVDLMSFTAHKLYGPKGVGALWVRRSSPAVRLEPQIAGGGHEGGFRSGTLNVPGIVGFARALELCLTELPAEQNRLQLLRDRLFSELTSSIDEVTLNGPALSPGKLRLSGNLNVSFAYVDGEALLMNLKSIAVSSGSACTSANPEPSHVLRALGIPDDAVRSSLRFGLGRFNTAEDVEFAVPQVAAVVTRLRKLSSMA
jgi:cysteine desulfurase